MEKRLISIVEDEPSLSLLLKYNLEQKGYDIVQYSSGDIFLNRFGSYSPQLAA
jgi:DNA-binding response OmpR family regulator